MGRMSWNSSHLLANWLGGQVSTCSRETHCQLSGGEEIQELHLKLDGKTTQARRMMHCWIRILDVCEI